MILIISESFDPSTEDVIDWLIFFSAKFYRINIDDKVKFNVEIKYTETSVRPEYILHHNSKKIYLSSITAVWYRRGGFPKAIDYSLFNFENLESNASSELIKNLREENWALLDSVYKKLIRLPNVIILGRRETGTLNKLDTLDLALSVGIKVPKYIVCNDKKSAIDFYNSCNGNIISKAIHENPLFYDDCDRAFICYVEKVTFRDLEQKGDNFMTTLLQEAISKNVELRIFFLVDRFYPMAIFSQLDNQTSVDFRVYNEEKPNRTIPFSIPTKLEKKLLKLMKLLNLETASLDVILGNDGEYYFLEANPVGQFGMTSYPCNYNLEKEIAQYLINGKN